mgnify:CR=1 FL=1
MIVHFTVNQLSQNWPTDFLVASARPMPAALFGESGLLSWARWYRDGRAHPSAVAARLPDEG